MLILSSLPVPFFSSIHTERVLSYQEAMNNEKKLDSNPSVKFVFNGDAMGDTHFKRIRPFKVN